MKGDISASDAGIRHPVTVTIPLQAVRVVALGAEARQVNGYRVAAYDGDSGKLKYSEC